MPCLLVDPIGAHGVDSTRRVCVAPSLGAFSPLAGFVRAKPRFRALRPPGHHPVVDLTSFTIDVDGACGRTIAQM